MPSAPSVSYPVGLPRVVMRCLWGAWGCGLACIAGALAAGGGGRLAGLGTFVLVPALWLTFFALRSFLSRRNEGVLHFDGEAWSFSGEPLSGDAQVEVCLDFQSLMLLALRVGGRPRRWLWLTRAAQPLQWHDLRRAVYSRAPRPLRGTAAAISPTSGASPTLS